MDPHTEHTYCAPLGFAEEPSIAGRWSLRASRAGRIYRYSRQKSPQWRRQRTSSSRWAIECRHL